jgi:hypothetical protein
VQNQLILKGWELSEIKKAQLNDMPCMVSSTMHLHCHVAYLGDVLLLNYNFQSLEAIWLFDHWASSNSLTN